MLAVMAQGPDSGLIDYGSTNVLHKDESQVVLEFLDFYRYGNKGKEGNLRYVVFDSRFTNYENLAKLDDARVKFITIRRRGKQMIDKINQIPADRWKKIKVDCAGKKHRVLRVCDEQVFLKGYEKNIRQIIIKGMVK